MAMMFKNNPAHHARGRCPASPARFLLTISGLFLSASTAAAQPMFRPLGMLPGETRSAAAGISGDGRVVVGWTLAPTPATNGYAVRWDLAGTMHLLVPQDGLSSAAGAASFDGSIILGGGAGGATWLWTEASGRQFIPSAHGALATVGMALSASGSAMTGFLDMGPTSRLFRWRSSHGVEDLGTIFGQQSISGIGISADGDVIAGTAGNTFPGHRAIRWTPAAGIELLPMLPGATSCFSYGISGDGNVIVGYCEIPVLGRRAFRWTETESTTALGALPGAMSVARAANWDGSVIVGYSLQVWDGGWVWTQQTGMVRISSLLPPGTIPPGYSPDGPRSVSFDGLTIAGWGDNPQFMSEAFVLRLPSSACYANCDGSTAAPILNIDDFTCFINEFAAAGALPPAQQVEHYVNCDNSTAAPVLNIDDFTCFINSFAAGCP
jgi:uncharacterized membrane protein